MENIRQTCLDILSQRGYSLESDEKDTLVGVDDNGDKICVFLEPTTKLSTQKVQEYSNVAHTLECSRCIVVYMESITPKAKQNIAELVNTGLRIEPFQYNELQINITKHELVPQHTKLSTEDSKRFLKKYGNNHPVLSTLDPVSRFYGFCRGDVVRVTRKGGYVVHRIVKGV